MTTKIEANTDSDVKETKTYLTEIRNEGPRINARSWDEAEQKAQEQGAILVGELAS